MKATPNLPNVGVMTPPSALKHCALLGESRSTQAAARALNSSPKLLYQWQKEAFTPGAAARGAELDPATAAELHQLRALARRQA